MVYDVVSTIWFWIAFISYLAILAVIGYISHKKTKNITDFLIASRGIGTILLGLSYGVTYFSAVLLIGCPGLTWIFGQQWILITLMNTAFGTFAAFLILGNRSRRMSKKLGALTLPEMIAERYQDKTLIRPTAGLVIAVFQTIYLVSIFLGLSTLLTVLFPGNPYAFYIAVVMCGVITCLYLIIGGAHSAILSDLIESIIMLIGVLGIVIGGLFFVGGLANMNANIIADINASGGPFASNPEAWFIFPNIMSMSMIGMAFVTTFGTWGSPQMSTRFFTAKDRKSVRYGMVIACVWVFVVSFCAWFAGAVGRGLSPTSTADLNAWITSIGGNPAKFREYVMPWILADQNILPLAFTALFLASVTAASLTTGEKIIIVASSAIARDFLQKGIMKEKNMSDERTLFWTRISIICIVAVAIALTFIQPAFILDLCMFSWAALNAFTLVPFVAGLFWKGGTKRAAFISGIIALAVAIGWFFCFNPKLTVPGLPLFPDIGGIVLINEPIKITINSIHEFLVSQAIAIPSFFLISWLDKKKPNKEFLDDLFKYVKEDTNE
ncbi:MAG: sodium:solute symporter family transporter [Candidatus Helarchaeota archaeon]